MGGTSSTETNGQAPGLDRAGGGGQVNLAERGENTDKIRGMARLMNLESKQHEQDDDRDHNKENMQILKQLYKKMDPTVMKSQNGVQGEIEISFKFDYEREVLLVKVIRARGISGKDLRGKNADPYAKLVLYPDPFKQGEKTTNVAKKTLSPVWHEIFVFGMTELQLLDTRLLVQLWDHDLLDYDDFIGEVIVDLQTFNFDDEPQHTAWYSLQMETDLDICGELEIGLEFQPPQTLLLTVFGAHNLTQREDDRLPHPYVKIQIPGIQALYQTKVEEKTLNPVWQETFEFPMAVEEFQQRYVILHIIDQDYAGENDSLGQVIIDLDNLDPNTGYHGSFALADLRNHDRLRAKWFQDATLQEFRESLQAHAAFKCPKFLFSGRKTGSKVVTVTSRKAGAKAKLRIVNGIPVY